MLKFNFKLPVVRNQTSCEANLDLCCPKEGFGCGVRYPPVKNAPKAIEQGIRFDLRPSKIELLFKI